MSFKIIIGMILAGVLIYFGWLFFWPLVECTYAQSFDPLFSDNIKFGTWFLGGFIFWIGFYRGIRFII